MRNNRKWWE